MNDGVTTYRSGERDLRVLHSEVGELSQKWRPTHRGIMEGRSGSGIGMISYAAASPKVAVGDVGAWVPQGQLKKYMVIQRAEWLRARRAQGVCCSQRI